MKIKITKSASGLIVGSRYTVFSDLKNSKKSQVIYDEYDKELLLSSLNGCYVVVDNEKQVFNQAMIEMTDCFTLVDMLGVTAVYSGLSYDDAIINVHVTPLDNAPFKLTGDELLNINCDTISATCVLL